MDVGRNNSWSNNVIFVILDSRISVGEGKAQ